MRIPNDLRRAAIAAFQAGDDWSRFVAEHGHAITEAEPYDRAAYQRMRGRLLHLCVSGESSGEFGCGDPDAIAPWDLDDDTPVVDDTITTAKFSPAATTPA